MNFGNYTVTESNKEAYSKSKAFLTSGKSIYIYGNPGGGKTHLLASAYTELIKTECMGYIRFYNVAKLLKIDRYEFETREEAEDRLLSFLSKKKVVFLDDFSSENVTGRTAEFIYLLLNDAIENGKPRLFITGNKSLKYISENISDRIASRISGLCGKDNIVKVDSEDWRLK